MRVSLDHPESTALYAAVIARPGHVGPRCLSHARRVSWAEAVAEARAGAGTGFVLVAFVPKIRRPPPSAKLNATQALAIRDDPRHTKVIAKHYNISEKTVYKIKRRLTWRNA